MPPVTRVIIPTPSGNRLSVMGDITEASHSLGSPIIYGTLRIRNATAITAREDSVFLSPSSLKISMR